MTKWEVRRNLGYTYSYSGVVLVKGQVHVTLVGNDRTAMLAFDEEDRLIWLAWEENRRRPSLHERCRWLLGERIRE